MLQQTQVATVIPYYARFMHSFPDISSLSKASQDEVLQHWAGLGYYARGRNLHRAAQIITSEHGGQFPQNIKAVNALPGIGRSTAGAILALSLNQRHPILDGNVKRSLCRYHGIEGFPGIKIIEAQLWALAEQHTPIERASDYTQAIMDMGATLCTRSKPDCDACPHRADCIAFQQDRVKYLPTPRPKRNKPYKHKYMLILSDNHHNVVAFKRPQQGIWGGLYSLPEFDTMPLCSDFILQYANKNSIRYHTGEDIKHSFTHFELNITPIYLRYSADDLKIVYANMAKAKNTGLSGVYLNQASRQLHQLGEHASQWGLPAPVQTILERRPLNESHYRRGIPEAAKVI